MNLSPLGEQPMLLATEPSHLSSPKRDSFKERNWTMQELESPLPCAEKYQEIGTKIGHGGQDTGHGGQDTGHGGQDTGHGGQDTGHGGQLSVRLCWPLCLPIDFRRPKLSSASVQSRYVATVMGCQGQHLTKSRPRCFFWPSPHASPNSATSLKKPNCFIPTCLP